MAFHRLLLLALAAVVSVHAFIPAGIQHHQQQHGIASPATTTTCHPAIWRHWIPDAEVRDTLDRNDPTATIPSLDDEAITTTSEVETIESNARRLFFTSLLALALTLPQATVAVSGGGLDYANIDITGQDFSNGNYKGKDFTQVIAKGTNFAKSNLQGCRFYKAYLVGRLLSCTFLASKRGFLSQWIPFVLLLHGGLGLFF